MSIFGVLYVTNHSSALSVSTECQICVCNDPCSIYIVMYMAIGLITAHHCTSVAEKLQQNCCIVIVF